MTTSTKGTRTTFTPLTVTSAINDPHDCLIITFDTSEHGDRFRFAHGQHVNLRHEFDGVDVRRSYSICSGAPDGELRIAIRQVPGGVFSTWATDELRPGSVVEVTEPTGHFTHDLDPAVARRYTFFAAGSGITPIYSMIATILATEPESQVALVYLNRTSLTSMLIDDVHDLHDRYLGRLRVAFAFTREASGSELLSGRPDRARFDALVDAGFLPADADEAFLCGPIELTDIARDALVAAGMEPASIHREIFTTKQQGTVTLAPQDVTETSVVVATGTATLNGRQSDFEVYEGDSVLDAVQRARPDAPYSCRSGVCSTCQAVVRDGQVEMAVNYGLTDDEVARGYVLTCQSTPLTDTVAVDFDA
ncbi:ring-1,2-phenylacetyl-CoA epoxidase subunit PaaE [Ilumatobacter fluminis]|uniref:Ring-1,2-phenylacetyl-CoA epoxidase subunit PaaE n=1 Tax=Ilumatobacter fluminis TaxID=467091 RepID=A0A4R7HZT5_9ACTN|nr:2Fe-2S iron-sulfur cluster-binding protein [Ilumatobacter fluminis]TDT16069.1 ring-1,2-phenylacetyl-CoA epoxidase subunit PaaE [Ilumatobacter fluminis]